MSAPTSDAAESPAVPGLYAGPVVPGSDATDRSVADPSESGESAQVAAAPGVAPHAGAPGPTSPVTVAGPTHAEAGRAADAAPGETGASAVGVPVRPPLVRSTTDRWFAGVCGGLAEHLGVPSWAVRLAFVAISLVYYLGFALYGLLWVVMPDADARTEAPGLEAARRMGMRSARHDWKRDAAPLAGLGLLAAGVIWLTNSLGTGLSNTMLWPALFAVCGVALVWRQADADEETDTRTAAWLRPFLRTGGWMGFTRMAVGLMLVGVAVSMVTASRIGVRELPTVLAMALLLVLGVMIAAAPWMYRARRSLNKARDEKLLADARADMAAHLHDSVLQSLALIQRQADDPKAVSRTARRQERELRQWLYGDQAPVHESVKAALTSDAADIEADREVSIEVVVVGDAPITENTEAIVAAAKEAMTNAAKHSGAPTIDVFCEVDDGICEVFVRDRGKGFDLDAVDPDRQGVRGSLIGRMERHGGQATIRSSPGEGTDIRLRIPVG